MLADNPWPPRGRLMLKQVIPSLVFVRNAQTHLSTHPNSCGIKFCIMIDQLQIDRPSPCRHGVLLHRTLWHLQRWRILCPPSIKCIRHPSLTMGMLDRISTTDLGKLIWASSTTTFKPLHQPRVNLTFLHQVSHTCNTRAGIPKPWTYYKLRTECTAFLKTKKM